MCLHVCVMDTTDPFLQYLVIYERLPTRATAVTKGYLVRLGEQIILQDLPSQLLTPEHNMANA